MLSCCSTGTSSSRASVMECKKNQVGGPHTVGFLKHLRLSSCRRKLSVPFAFHSSDGLHPGSLRGACGCL